METQEQDSKTEREGKRKREGVGGWDIYRVKEKGVVATEAR